MPAKKAAAPAATSPIVDDLSGPILRATVYGHELKLSADHFNVAIAARYLGFDAERERLMAENRPADVLRLLADLFCDAILPANPEWDRERLLRTFPPVIQRKILDGFFTSCVPYVQVAVELIAHPVQ
jgi:hypothetical protein